jgi:hypothetical protein
MDAQAVLRSGSSGGDMRAFSGCNHMTDLTFRKILSETQTTCRPPLENGTVQTHTTIEPSGEYKADTLSSDSKKAVQAFYDALTAGDVERFVVFSPVPRTTQTNRRLALFHSFGGESAETGLGGGAN